MLFRNLGLVLLVVVLAGCNNEKVRNLIDQRASEAQVGVKEAQKPAARKTYDPLTVSEKVWAGSAATRMRRGLPLPGKYETPRGVSIVSGNPLSLSDFATTITTQTGIPVRINPGASVSAEATPATGGHGMPIAYEGPLSGLLDQVSGYFGINWKYDGSSINFARYETRVFAIEALPGTQSVKDGIKESSDSGSGSSGGSSGSSGSSSSSTNDLQQSSEMTVELKVWDELQETVNAILGGVGSAVIAPSSGTLTVTTTPEIMRTVSQYIETENKRMSKQIAINVVVYSVSLSEGTDFSVALSTAFKNLKDFGANYTGPSVGSLASQTTGAGSLGLAIFGPVTNTTGEVNPILSALSTLGDTSRVAQFPMTTLNNKPVTRRVGRDKAYVSSIENSTNSNDGGDTITSTVTASTVQEGFALQVTPRLLDDGRIMLQYSFSLTDILGITNFSAGTSTVQLPETANRVFVQQSLLRSGSTLVIGGFDDEQVAQDARGVGHPFNFLLGGGSTNSKTRTMLFISITPQVLDVPRSEQE